MRVLFFSSIFPNRFDVDRGLFNQDLIGLLGTDHDIRVVCPIGWTECWPRKRRFGPPSGSNERVECLLYYYVPRTLYAYRDVFMWWSMRRRLWALVRDWRPEVVVAYWTHPDGAVARRLASRLGVPFVQIVGGSDVLVRAHKRRHDKIVGTLSAADVVVTIGGDLRERVIALGADAERVVSVHRPVSALFGPGPQRLARRELQLPDDVPIVLWVGRFVPVKALDVLIEAVRRLTRDVPDVRVYLVGTGPEVARIQALVRRHELDHVVHFVGSVARDRLGHWYRAADVTVLSSVSEGVPNVLLESVACGTPFVATGVGGVPEIADSSTDRLVPPGDPEALAQALSERLSHRLQITRRPRTVTAPEAVRAQFNHIFESVVRPLAPTVAAQASAGGRPRP